MNKVKTKYKYAVIAADVAVFTVQNRQLQVLLIEMEKEPFAGQWALPGGLIKSNESIDDAAARILQAKVNIKGVYLEQLSTFGRVNRDPFGRVVSVAYFSLIPSQKQKIKTTNEYNNVAWFALKDLPSLAYDHEEMLRAAHEQLKKRLEYSNIACHLLPREFTLTDLQCLYEMILSHKIDKRNFRKRLLQNHFLQTTGKKRHGAANRPAKLYQFASRRPQTVRVL